MGSRDALAEPPARRRVGGCRRPPAGGARTASARGAPLPAPPRLALQPAETLLAPPNPLSTPRFPGPPGEGGEPCHDLARGSGTGAPTAAGVARPRPFISLQNRAWGAPVSHSINGGGTLPSPRAEAQGTLFLFRKGWRRFSAPKRREPRRKRGQLPLPSEARKPNLSHCPPKSSHHLPKKKEEKKGENPSL